MDACRVQIVRFSSSDAQVVRGGRRVPFVTAQLESSPLKTPSIVKIGISPPFSESTRLPKVNVVALFCSELSLLLYIFYCFVTSTPGS